jgi:hypothetical protein
MTTNEIELWQKIKNFQFDRPNIKLTFAKRLARENNFTDSFTKEIIEEYKKFIFLCCISNQQITPSHYVDLAWHLHLTYTKSYWIELCQNTICKEIHHNPTEGGKTENNKFRNCYNETIELYKSKFIENPPLNIWQNDNDRFKNKISNIDRSKNWIIPKPVFSKFGYYLILFAFSLLFLGCNQADNTTFPILVFVVIFGFIIYNISNKNRNNSNNNSSDSSSSGCGTSSEGHSHHNNDDSNNDSNDGDSSDGGDSGGDGGGCSGCGGGD